MKRSTRAAPSMSKQQYAKKVEELEQDKRSLQKQVEELTHKLGNASVTCKGRSLKVEDDYIGKLNDLEGKVSELRKKLEGQSLLLKQKQKSDEAAKRLQDEICRIKSQKVELQRKVKQESVQFRSLKALQDREVHQLTKDIRKNEYVIHKLLDANQRLKMVLQQKTKEASVNAKWLKGLLKSRKASSRSGTANDPQLQVIEHQLEVTELLNEVRAQCDHKLEERVRMAEEAAKYKEEADELMQKKLWCLLEEKEADGREKDSAIRDLNKKVIELGSLVEQLKVRNEEFTHLENLKGHKASLISGFGGNNTELKDVNTSESDGLGIANSDTTTQSGSEMAKHNSSVDMADSNRTTESGSGTAEISISPRSDCLYGEASVTLAGQTACCSCSKKSLCKTNKCECRALGGHCGAPCGCASTKCTNREAVLVKQIKSSLLLEMSNALASHNGLPCQNAPLEKPSGRIEDCRTRPKPLSDIGNTENAARPNQRKKRSSR